MGKASLLLQSVSSLRTGVGPNFFLHCQAPGAGSSVTALSGGKNGGRQMMLANGETDGPWQTAVPRKWSLNQIKNLLETEVKDRGI